MKRTTKVLLVTGAAAFCVTFQSAAEFTGYWEIGGGPTTNVSHGPGVNVATPLSGGANLGDLLFPWWTFRSTGNGGEFQRSPLTLGADAVGFSLTAYANTKVWLEIIAPTGPSVAGNDWVSAYKFNWSVDIRAAGVSAGWVDKNGVNHIMRSTPGLEARFDQPWLVQDESILNPGQMYSFWIDNQSSVPVQTLQIQGLVPIPEPASLAMASMIGLASLGYSIRRWKSSKS